MKKKSVGTPVTYKIKFRNLGHGDPLGKELLYYIYSTHRDKSNKVKAKVVIFIGLIVALQLSILIL